MTTASAAKLERISIELTNRCAKACAFCYSSSGPGGESHWSPADVVTFVRDCALYGVRAVSFGGGEPLEYEGLDDVLRALDGVLFRSLTTNGMLLEQRLDRLLPARPDKVHVSIHFPERTGEVERVITQVRALFAHGIPCGINLLVARSRLEDATRAARAIADAGIGHDRLVFLPMRHADTPTPEEMGRVAGRSPFQSTTCLMACGPSPRFAAIGWDRSVGWCSYTRTRRRLATLEHRALAAALSGLGLDFCGGARRD